MIEDLITFIARRRSKTYLRFIPSRDMGLPISKGDTPKLLYCHIPFCEELCPYCSFHRVVFKRELAIPYFDALRKEVMMYKALGYDFQAVYIGGGTPTVMMDELEKTIELLRANFSIKEVSTETNPNHLTPDNLKRLKEIGVNRLSVGVQSFDDGILKAIGRYYKSGSGDEIAERLKETEGMFDTVNADMIFNFPTQTVKTLERDLSILNQIKIGQVTYYPLMVSDYAAEAMAKSMGKVDYKRGNAFYSVILDALSKDYLPTTAWCFSRKKGMIDEYVVNFDEYAGLGSGSIGYLDGVAYANTFDIREYIEKINMGIFPLAGKRAFSLKEKLSYDLLMKLFGLKLDLRSIEERYGASLKRHMWQELLFFVLTGALRQQDGWLYLTRKGQYYWVIMMREFFIGVNNFRDYCRALVGEKN